MPLVSSIRVTPGSGAVNFSTSSTANATANAVFVTVTQSTASIVPAGNTINANSTELSVSYISAVTANSIGNGYSLVSNAIITNAVSYNVYLKSLAAGNNISIASNATTITISSSATPNTIFTSNVSITGTNNLAFATGTPNVPTYGSSSPGTKLILYPFVSNSSADYAIGVSSGTIWVSLAGPYTSDTFAIYGGNTVAHTFDGMGNYTANGAISANSFNGNTVNVTGNLQIFGANTIAKEVYIYSTMNSVTSNRWQFGVTNGDYPGGNNTGANFVFSAYSDSGSFISTPITITRATGLTTFSGNVAVGPGYASNFNISFGTSAAAPTFNTSSIGSRLILLPSVSNTATDYAIGVSPGGQGLWLSLPQYNNFFSFLIYGGTQIVHTFDAVGNYTPASSIKLPNVAPLYFTDLAGNHPYFNVDSSNNFNFYGTNSSGSTRSIWSITQNSSTSSFNINVPATAVTVANTDNTSNIATTAFVKNQSYPARYSVGVNFDSSGNINASNGIVNLPSGWTASRDASNQMTITHNLGLFPSHVSFMSNNESGQWIYKTPNGNPTANFSVAVNTSNSTPSTFTVYGLSANAVGTSIANSNSIMFVIF